MLLVLVSVSVMFTSSVCSDYIGSIKEAARPTFGKQLFIRLTVCALCVMHICKLC